MVLIHAVEVALDHFSHAEECNWEAHPLAPFLPLPPHSTSLTYPTIASVTIQDLNLSDALTVIGMTK